MRCEEPEVLRGHVITDLTESILTCLQYTCDEEKDTTAAASQQAASYSYCWQTQLLVMLAQWGILGRQ